ncbi:MAG: cell division protein ZapA [Peptococcaceae bacterium]|nr:cell division protein ZapA [Peptococcaceae bacterium]
MAEKINRVEVVINGETYILKGTETPEYMESLASDLNRRLSEIQGMNPRLSTYQTAVLTALNILDEYTKLKGEHQTLVDLLEGETREKAKK